jgi:hypothetical protein
MSRHPHWKPHHLELVKKLETYAGMRDLAFALLQDLPTPIIQVCGPLTTGGRGSFEANVEALHDAIHWLVGQGKNVFDQRPFETPMRRLVEARTAPGYAYDLLTEFYLPLFESGHIKELHFLHDWESSTGARWEYEQGVRLGIAIFHIPQDFSEKS